MNKEKTYIDIAILGCILIFCSTFPFSSFLTGDFVYLFEIIMQIGFIAFYIFYTKHYKLLDNEKKTAKNSVFIVFLPVFIACFSNYFTILFNASTIDNQIDISFLYRFILLVVSVVAEELLFSRLLYPNIRIKKPLYKIVVFASIFALFHLTHFLSTFNPYDLIIIAYSFGIGLVLGLINEYTSILSYCFLFHLIFNLFNNLVFESIAIINNYALYILINCLVAASIVIYLIGLYLIYLKKRDAR